MGTETLCFQGPGPTETCVGVGEALSWWLCSSNTELIDRNLSLLSNLKKKAEIHKTTIVPCLQQAFTNNVPKLTLTLVTQKHDVSMFCIYS